MSILWKSLVYGGIVLLSALANGNAVQEARTSRNVKRSTTSSAMERLCALNDAQGNSANAGITEICESMKFGNLPSSDKACVRIPTPSASYTIHNDTLSLTDRLSKGTLEIERRTAGLENDPYPAVFIMGNPGSGKTTLAQIINGNLSRLYATKTEQGQMVFMDYDNLITPPTSVSRGHTLIPNFMVNPDNADVFWDCPGFHENRSAEMDIAGAYFIRRALNQVSHIKFLFTLPHTSVTVEDGEERFLDFDLLLTHVANFLKYPSQLSKSVGLVITKVASNSSDDVILTETTGFLEEYIEMVTNNTENAPLINNALTAAKKLQLVHAFLGTNETSSGGGSAHKICFVRVPTHCGTLTEMPSISHTKQIITELYHERLQYSSVDPENFGIILRNETTNAIPNDYIRKSVMAIQEQVEKSGNHTFKLFKSKFYEKLSSTKFGEEPWSYMRNASRIMNSYLEAIRVPENVTSADGYQDLPFSSQLIQLYNDIDVTTHKDDCLISSIKELEDQLNFLEMASGHHITRPVLSWLEPLLNFSKEIQTLQEFYDFCYLVDKELGTYSKQVILSGLEFKSSHVLEFLNRNNLVTFPAGKLVFWNESLGLGDKAYLAKIVQAQIPSVKLKCVASSLDKVKYQLVVSGRNVKFSDFLGGSTLQHGSWRYPCTEKSVKEITVLAQDTVFVDRDLHGDCKELQVSIIAPTWVIGNEKSIRLSCSNTKRFTASAGSLAPWISEGYPWGNPGPNGEDGQTGTNGGSFFGIFSKVVNGEKLHINASGQNGGDGQDGGQGYWGEYGRNGLYDDLPSAAGAFYTGRDISDGILFGYAVDNGTIIDGGNVFGVFYGHKWYTVKGGPGKKGGDGGRGGDAGSPGRPGKITLLSSNGDPSNISPYVTTGVSGKPGKGGIGGPGGYNGNHHSCRISTITLVAYYWSGCYNVSILTRVESGMTGSDGTVPVAPVQKPLKAFEPWRIINEYKKSFFDNPPKLKFMDQLDQNVSVVSLTTPRSLAEELEYIEERYWKDSEGPRKSYKMQQKYLELYNKFLNKLRLFASIRWNASRNPTAVAGSPATTTNDPTGERIALNYIYATAIGKIIGMRQSRNTLSVVDTEGYFDALAGQLDLLRAKQKEKAINEESSKFQDKLNEKVNEAMNFIHGTVLPAISTAEKSLDAQIEKLARELNAYLKAAEDNVEKQKEIKRDFVSSLPIRYLMSGLKVVGAACSFFGPVGQMVGGTLSAVTTVAEPFVLDSFPSKSDSRVDFSSVAGDFTSLMKEQNKKYYEGKIEQINTQIELTKEVAAKEGIKLSDLGDLGEKTEIAEQVVEDFTKALNQNGVDPVTLIREEIKLDKVTDDLSDAVVAFGKQPVERGASDWANEVLGELDKVGNEPGVEALASSPATPSEVPAAETVVSSSPDPQTDGDTLKIKLEKKQKREKRIRSAISAIGKAVKVAGAGFDFLRGVMDGQTELGRLDDIISKAKENVQGLELKKDAMYREFLPMLETATVDLQAEQKDLSGQSQVGLTVKKWKVKEMMKNMKRNLAEFTKGMKVAEEFQLCVDTLNEAMTLMIDLYDRIEQYEEKKQFADYIANINSATDARSKIKDGELKKAIGKMELSMHANLFVEDYHRAIAAFKQWVFPFAGDYLAAGNAVEVDLASILNTTSEQQALDEVVGIYKTKVETLSNQIKKYKTTTVENDENLIVTHFSGDTVSSHPFFIWTNKKWHGSIKRLLSGKAVRLLADMDADRRTKQMLRGKSAMKYKTIEVHFRAKNASIQGDLNEKLKHFRMKMTHSGISMYKVTGQKFVIFDRNQTHRYSFERRQSGTGGTAGSHLSQNVVSYKVGGTRADFLKSPYTWWTFQLIDATPGRGIDHQHLVNDFAGNVDLELVGDGMYLDELHGSHSKLKVLNMSKFYQVYIENEDAALEASATMMHDKGEENCPIY